MTRGRTPSKSDDEAIAAMAEVRDFLRKSRISATALARQIDVSPSSVLRALKTQPPRWTPTLHALEIFIKSHKLNGLEAGGPLEAQLNALRGAGSASAAAAVLRAVADLLERAAD
jgi:DNA-binding transcriptional ArsR family regulator